MTCDIRIDIYLTDDKEQWYEISYRRGPYRNVIFESFCDVNLLSHQATYYLQLR